MSPKAVTERFKTMNELWTLRGKLMNSKKASSSKTTKDQVTSKPYESVNVHSKKGANDLLKVSGHRK